MSSSEPSSLDRLCAWYRARALPLWLSAGFDEKAGLFHERLTFEREPLSTLPRRLMVQARQVSVCCEASRLGLHERAGELANLVGNRMVESFRGKGEGGGWAFSTDAAGVVADGKADLYAHAFALFALAHLHRLEPQAGWDTVAGETFNNIHRLFGLPQGGFAPSAGTPETLLQNPVMHLFEAWLELIDAGLDEYRTPAEQLATFALTQLVNEDSGAICECFDTSWNPLSGDANWVEPGHQYEWAWLLHRAQDLLGRDTTETVARLMANGRAGLDGGSFLVDEQALDGAPRTATRRLWPHTEAIRAELAVAPGGAGQNAAEHFAARLLEGFIDPAPDGGWIDRIDASGKPLSADMPASSLYHLSGAVNAVLTPETSRTVDG
ncbi:AGE family epimerase/isomerase [Tepidamorphus sp. 3E244]|uniref:AGE family epimerase/isomerase n=1 Tax=Tepidamorphus sp. 3E244 TaxID=3385498 RepID=UPI0038FC8137